MTNSNSVLHIVEDFSPLAEASGGAPISIRNQIEALAAHCTVIVLAPRIVFLPLGRYRDRRRVSAPGQAASDPPGMEVLRPHYLHLPLLWPLTEPLQLLLLTLWHLIRMGGNVRLIHGHRMYPMGITAVLAAKFSGRFSIVTAHGSDVHTQAIKGDWRVRGWIRLAIRWANMIIAVSRELIGTLTSLGVDPSRRHYIPNGVDISCFRPGSRADARRGLGVSENGSVIINVAAFVPVKGHSILIEAFDRLARRRNDVHLILIGDGPLREDIEHMVQAAGLQDRIRLTGNVDHRRIPEWLAAADAFVLSSLNEGTPLSALEALASGRPVVGSDSGGTPEVICTEELGIIVPPGDVEKLAAALEAVLDRSWDPDQLRERAVEFAWPTLAGRILDIYERLRSGELPLTSD